MDFGIAKVPHLELTSAGQFFGTPLYMSPEQASGAPVDGRSDLFSLGAIAYQLLTGRQAFRAENVIQVLSRVVNDTPAPPSRLVPGLPAGVDRVIARALAKEPDRRYPSGEDMAADIDALLASRPAGAGGRAAPCCRSTTSRWPRCWRRRPPPPRRRARLRRRNPLPPPVADRVGAAGDAGRADPAAAAPVVAVGRRVMGAPARAVDRPGRGGAAADGGEGDVAAARARAARSERPETSRAAP